MLTRSKAAEKVGRCPQASPVLGNHTFGIPFARTPKLKLAAPRRGMTDSARTAVCGLALALAVAGVVAFVIHPTPWTLVLSIVGPILLMAWLASRSD